MKVKYIFVAMFVLLILSITVHGQPSMINFQGTLTDGVDNPVKLEKTASSSHYK